MKKCSETTVRAMTSEAGKPINFLIDRKDILDFSLKDLIDLRAREISELPFLLTPGLDRPLEFHSLKDHCLRISAALRTFVPEPGQTVSTMMPNGLASTLLLLSVIYSGRILCPLNLAAGDVQLAYVLEHSESSLLMVAPELRQRAQAILDGISGGPELIEIEPEEVPFTSFKEEIEKDATPGASDTGLLMYTSGTTGKPKGVMLSHQNLLSGGLNAMESHDLTHEDRALCVLPLYHINGLINTVMGPLVSGSSVFMPAKFKTAEFWNWILQYRCSWFSVVPTLLSALLHKTELKEQQKIMMQDFFRFGRSASAPLAPEVHIQFEQKFGVRIIETMGLTETSSPILSNPLPPGLIKYGSPGIAWGNKVRIVDKQLKPLNANEEGEIAVRGTNVMKGYFKNPDATSDALVNGWLLTGDLGIMDEEGYVFVKGRTKELIIKGGENIAPREIDEALYEHPDVVDAAAFAVEESHYGQEVEACVSLVSGSSCSSNELVEFCRPRLGEFKTPRKIHIMEDLPKGPSGKIQRLRLAEMTQDLS